MSFKEYIINVHPDPDFLGDKKVYDAFDELDRLAQNYAKDKTANLTKELQEAKTSDGRGWKAVDRLQRGNDALRNQLDDSNDEITRLTRDLKVVQSELDKYRDATVKKNGDITRLRELLGRCKGYLEGFIDKRYLSTGHELLTEIDNAIGDPSGPSAMGPGH